MLENEIYSIVKMHICSFEKKGNLFSLNLNEYPERLCVFDKNNKVAIDVETEHQYRYIRILNNQYFIKDVVKSLDSSKRVACMGYARLPYNDLDSKTLKKCMNIIKQLNEGFVFPDGNQELTNEEYLEVINSSKSVKKVKKIGRKRK